MLARLFAVVLLLAVPLASAVPPPSPTSLPITDRYVFAELGLAQPSLTELTLSGDLYIYRYMVNNRVYDADDLGQAFTQTNKYAGEVSGAAFVANIEGAAQEGLMGILEGSFPGASVSGITATVDRTSLVTPNGNPFDPPVRITVSGTIERTRAAVGLGSLSDAAVDAAFASGATVLADFTLKADPGYHILFSIGAPTAPAGLRFLPDAGVSSDGRTLVADVDNSGGFGVPVSVTARLRDPAATPATAEDIRSSIEVTMGAIGKDAAGIPIEVAVTADVLSLDVGQRFPGVLPAKVSLPFIHSDGLRALRTSGAIKDSDIATANDALISTIRADVSRAFGPGATVTGGLSTADLAKLVTKPYGADEPLAFLASAKTTYAVAGATGDDLDLALRIGGTANVDLTLFAANGRETEYTIHPLEIAEFTAAKGGKLAADRSSATFTVPAGATQYGAGLALRGKGVPTFSAEDASVNVKVDLQDLDVSLGQVAGGDFGNLLMEITVTGELGVIALPDELKSALPASLDLEYISADAIRLLIEHGKISDENLTKLEDSLLQKMQENLGRALDGDIPVTGGLDRATLAASLVATPISADKPITFQGVARVTKPLAGGPVAPQAAIALYSTQLPLTLPKLEGLDTAYTVILPRGLAVTDVQTSGGTSETSKAPDGRDQFTVTPESGDAQVTVSMAVTPTFVLAKFWPIVLLAVILVVLIVGTPIALIVRSRGKKKRVAAAKK